MAIPTFVAAGAFTTVTSGSAVPPLPSGWAVGDLHVLITEQHATTAVSAPSGWTDTGVNILQTNSRMQVFTRYAQSGDTDPSVACGSGPDHLATRIAGFRGVGGYEFGSPNSASSGTALTFLGMTTSMDDALVLMLMTTGRDFSGAQFSGYTNANLANITELFDLGTTINSGGGSAAASGEMATAGATGDSTATLSGASSWCAIHMALYPGARISQETVEVLVNPTSTNASLIQETAEVLLLPSSASAKLIQESAEVLMKPTTASAKLMQMQVEVLQRYAHETFRIVWGD